MLVSITKNKQLAIPALQNLYSLKSLNRSSNAASNVKLLRSKLPLNLGFPRLLFYKKNCAGRNITGSITIFSQGRKSKARTIPIAYGFRYNALFFIASFNFIPLKKAITALTFTSLGLVCYLPARLTDKLFTLTRLMPMRRTGVPAYRELLHFKPFISITRVPFMLIQQHKNAPVSFLEITPLLGSTYARSLGSAASIIKLDSRTGFSLVRLPSGIKKIFSAFSLAYAGVAGYPVLPRQLKNTKAGF